MLKTNNLAYYSSIDILWKGLPVLMGEARRYRSVVLDIKRDIKRDISYALIDPMPALHVHVLCTCMLHQLD